MNPITEKLTYDQMVQIIDSLAPCMYNYLYVYELKSDRYTISESALERFNLPGKEYTDVVEMHRTFTHPDDIDMLVEDLTRMVEGVQDFHDLKYRWLGKDGEPIWINCRGRVLKGEDGKPELMIGCINESF